MSLENFSWPIRVYYEDTDAGGVVYHANYLKFFERARTEKLRALGYEQDQLRDIEGILFAVRSLQIDYLKPALFNQLLQVTAEVTLIKRASLTFEQSIKLEQPDTDLICTASVRIACISAHTMRPTPIPDNLLNHIRHDA